MRKETRLIHTGGAQIDGSGTSTIHLSNLSKSEVDAVEAKEIIMLNTRQCCLVERRPFYEDGLTLRSVDGSPLYIEKGDILCVIDNMNKPPSA